MRYQVPSEDEARLDAAVRRLAEADSNLAAAQQLLAGDPDQLHWIRKMRTVLAARRAKLAARGLKKSV